jgi:deoxyribodipyrimidine photolyase-related protein
MSPHRAFIILPTQLYHAHNSATLKGCDVYVVEDPVYYYDKVYKPFKVNKVKVAFIHACVNAYCEAKKFTKVSFDNIQNTGYKFLQRYQEIVMYDPIDDDILAKYQNISKTYNASLFILESPDLLINKSKLGEYFNKQGNKIKHATFYEFMKRELDVLEHVKNLDKENRCPPPKTPPHAYHSQPSKNTLIMYDEAIDFANKYFPEHFGNASSVKLFPITHTHANKAFASFLKERLPLFGKYEDAVMQEDPFMYHSVISPVLNVGLLTPKEVLKATITYYHKHSNSIPLSSLEGFIRQVIGWRAFMQALYIFKGKELIKSNLPNNQNTFRNISDWYNGTTGITPIDVEIKKAAQFGYSHHIVRLMMFLNFFILCEVHPHEIYKWFMEVISMDAYSWVMISNIYTMGYFYPRIMSKPYLSTSNYIVKMTNYKRDGQWDLIWDALYHSFVASKPSQYTFFYKRTVKNDENVDKIAHDFKHKHFVSIKRA